MHFHIPSYFDKTQTRHVGLLAIARWTGLVLCRNALWDSFEDARTIYVSYYKVAQEAGSKFVPQNIPIAQFDPKPTQSQEQQAVVLL